MEIVGAEDEHVTETLCCTVLAMNVLIFSHTERNDVSSQRKNTKEIKTSLQLRLLGRRTIVVLY